MDWWVKRNFSTFTPQDKVYSTKPGQINEVKAAIERECIQITER